MFDDQLSLRVSMTRRIRIFYWDKIEAHRSEHSQRSGHWATAKGLDVNIIGSIGYCRGVVGILVHVSLYEEMDVWVLSVQEENGRVSLMLALVGMSIHGK